MYNKKRSKRQHSYLIAERQAFLRHKNYAPVWVNREYLKLFYLMAKESQGEVDHIVPINHPLVCGLHTEDNLQIVTANYNHYKSNYFWPDMPEYSYKDWQDAYYQSRTA